MPKNLLLIILLLLLIYLSTYLYRHFTRPTALKTIKQTIAGQEFTLEIADTPYLLAKGLSNRHQLCPNCGMLFIFPFLAHQSFWMKDTLIPLDMIFIDQNQQISDIFTAQPEPNTADSQLKKYTGSRPSKYVIEFNAHRAQELKLQIDDKIDLHL